MNGPGNASALFTALCEDEAQRLFSNPILPIEQAESLTGASGVYALYYQGDLVYLGKAKNLRNRVRKHSRTVADAALIAPGEVEARVLAADSMSFATGLEAFLIGSYPTEWNGMGFGSNAHGKGRTDQKPSKWNLRYGRAVTR